MQQNERLNPTEEELLKQLKFRQRDALSLLYDRYAPVLFGLIRRIVKDEEIAQQVLLESFEHIWSSISLYNKEVNTLSAWLINIARDLALAKVRVRSSGIGDRTTGDALDSQPEIQDSSTIGDFKEPENGHSPEQTTLPPDQQRVLDLLFFEGYTPLQVAQKLHIPLESVREIARSEINAKRNKEL